MIQAGGPRFQEILHDVLGTLWQHEIQPKAWQMSLMQPIYKGGDKPRVDPASYRGIYLSSALGKLFEGILICRLTKFTQTHNTLTENRFGTRPGRQMIRNILTQYTAYSPLYNITYHSEVLQHMSHCVTSPPRSPVSLRQTPFTIV